MSNEVIKYDDNRYKQIEKRVLDLPSISNESLAQITQGLYAGKPLFGNGGLFTQLLKDLTQVALQGEMDAHFVSANLKCTSHLHEKCTKKKGHKIKGVNVNIDVILTHNEVVLYDRYSNVYNNTYLAQTRD